MVSYVVIHNITIDNNPHFQTKLFLSLKHSYLYTHNISIIYYVFCMPIKYMRRTRFWTYTLHSVYYTVYNVQCMAYSVRRILYGVQCTAYTVRCIWWLFNSSSKHVIYYDPGAYTVYTVYIRHCTLWCVHCEVHSVHTTVIVPGSRGQEVEDMNPRLCSREIILIVF